ncbi:hypothetical protein ACTXT7_006214 [Hymenolepis weldensis]
MKNAGNNEKSFANIIMGRQNCKVSLEDEIITTPKILLIFKTLMEQNNHTYHGEEETKLA